jgi:hypothetical protein
MTTLFAAALAAKLLTSDAADAAAGRPQSTAIDGRVACVALDRREAGLRGFHLFLCAEGRPYGAAGDVTGAVLTRAGRVVCTIDGTYDGRCLTLVGCGTTDTACR